MAVPAITVTSHRVVGLSQSNREVYGAYDGGRRTIGQPPSVRFCALQGLPSSVLFSP